MAISNLDFLLDFLRSTSAVIVTWLGILLTVWFAYYTFRFRLTSSLINKQLYKAYLPMFKMMEPHLYKDISAIGFFEFKKIMSELETLCVSNYELIDPQIISYIRRIERLSEVPDFERVELDRMYKRLCSKIDFGFEKTRKKLGLPTRNVFYKLNHRQYETKLELFYYLLVATWKEVATFIIFVYLTLWLISNY